jgi:hypothetical protein
MSDESGLSKAVAPIAVQEKAGLAPNKLCAIPAKYTSPEESKCLS